MNSQHLINHPNRLAKEQSAYLKSAAHQPVHWYPWGEEAFAEARSRGKPILLDIGAVWCHWCHVMDTESYENEEIAKIINDNFVPVKVDRDERPDIDARYQAAVSAVSGQGGWPLTAFLTPDGKVYYGATYFPPDDRYGKPGFAKVLHILAETYRNEPDKILQNATEIENAVRAYLVRSADTIELNDALVDSALDSISHDYDARNGGFGGAPKFPHSSAIEFLLARYGYSHDQWMIDVVKNTLRKMANGGMYDQLGGGFHRYSTDERWVVPHFEKMLYDNAPLLGNYIHAYEATGDEFFKSTALDIIRYADGVLSNHERGGFYASQDADVQPGDDGSYFTWSLDDARAHLTAEELDVLRLHYNIHEQGEMSHDSSQNVLFVDNAPASIASLLKKNDGEVSRLIAAGKKKLLEARSSRTAPFVDKTIYSSWNGMMISAYLEVFKALGLRQPRDFALQSLGRILNENYLPGGLVTHRASSISQEGFLDDQVEIANATLDAFEITSDQAFLDKAESIAKTMVKLFWDDREGGFFDTPKTQSAIASLTLPNKPIQDSPTPGANAIAASVLCRLYILTENSLYREYAEKTLKFFSGTVKNFGVFAATYFLALDEFLHPRPHIVVVSDPTNRKGLGLFDAALRAYYPGKIVSLVSPENPDRLPSSVRTMAGTYKRPVAYVCSEFVCAPPAFDAASLITTLEGFSRQAVIAK